MRRTWSSCSRLRRTSGGEYRWRSIHSSPGGPPSGSDRVRSRGMDRMTERLRTGKAALVSAAAAGALLIVGCGGEEDFENEPRPPVPLQLTGVITEESVTVSPRTVAPGPIVLIVSNQTEEPHSISLKGPEVDEQTGPIPPADTATVQATLQDTEAGEGY